MMSKWCEAQEDKVLFDMAPAIFECLQLSVTEADKKLAHKDMGKYVIALQHAAKILKAHEALLGSGAAGGHSLGVGPPSRQFGVVTAIGRVLRSVLQ